MALRTKPAVRGAQYVALAGYMLFLGFPLFYLLMASLKTTQQLASLDVWILPRTLHWANFTEALATQGIIRSTLNTLDRLVGHHDHRDGDLGTGRVRDGPIPRQAADRRYRLDPGQPGVPGDLDHHPVVLDPANDQPNDTLFGLTLVYTTFCLPFALWMLQGFVGAHPGVAGGSGRDGRGQPVHHAAPGRLSAAHPRHGGHGDVHLRVRLERVLLRPGLLQSPENFTLSRTLALFVGAEGQVRLGPLAAGAVLASIPSFIFFAILQRRLTGGLLSGAVKG